MKSKPTLTVHFSKWRMALVRLVIHVLQFSAWLGFRVDPDRAAAKLTQFAANGMRIGGRKAPRVTVGILVLLCAIGVQAQHRVLVIDNEAWDSGVSAFSSSGGAVHFDDCTAFGAPVSLPAGGSFVLDDVAQYLCTDVAPIAIVEFPAEEGVAVEYLTWATYRDSTGDQNVTLIPELGPALNLDQSATFEGVRSGGDLVTWLSVIPQIPGDVTLTVRAYDGSGTLVGIETLTTNGFQMYEVNAQLPIGKLVVTNVGSQFAPKPQIPVDIVALTGYRAGGSPRVVIGTINE